MLSGSQLSFDRWRQIEDIVHEAIQRNPEERHAFLETACGTDSDLRREVESLLPHMDESALFLEAAVQNAAASYLEHQSATRVETGAVLDHFLLLKLLGTGGMGEVYLAEDLRLKRKVALKMLTLRLTRDAVALQRLEREARVLSAMNHPGLLTVYEFCRFEGHHFLVTEFVEGETLRQLLLRGRLDQGRAVDIARQIASALGAAHASGLIHRDIKPENIMIRPDGSVKVLDFGIAKLTQALSTVMKFNGSLPAHPSTIAGAIVGTPRYMSPEQTRGTPVDHRTDLFSLGSVLYEMLTGKAPFEGQTYNELVADILRAEPAPLTRLVPEVPKQLQGIVKRTLEKDISRRYQTAVELLTDLSDFQERRLFQKRPEARRATVVLAMLLVALLSVTFFLVKQFARGPRPPEPRTLAVLPFRNLKPEAATDYLGFSLADGVISKLGYVKALTVRPSSSIKHYQDGVADLHRAAIDLNARTILTGTYWKDGDNLRITARLIGFNPDTVLWQNTLELKYDKLLTVQDRVAALIIQGLSLPLSADEQVRLKLDLPVNSLAYEYYLRGVDLYSSSNFASAIIMLEKSLAADPNYAPAWAYLGRAYTTNGSLLFGGRDHYRRAEEAYEKAIALNPVFPEPRIYMANLFTDTGRVEEAVPLLKVALQSSPNNAEAHWELGYAYRYGGMLKESLAEGELARRLDPEVKINSSAFNTYLYLLEYDKFLNSLPSNDSALLVFYHGFGSYYKNDLEEAGNDFDRAFDLAPELIPALIGKALSDGLQHHFSEGLDRLRSVEVRMKAQGVRDPEAMYKIAQAYGLLGDPISGLRMLQRSISGGFFCYPYMAHDPLLKGLRNLPEFPHILESAKQRHQQFEKRFNRPNAP